MAKLNGTGNVQDELNRMAPATGHAKLGDLLAAVIANYNQLLVRTSCQQLTTAAMAINGAGNAAVKIGASCISVVAGVPVRTAINTVLPALVGTLATTKSALWAFYIDAAGALTISAKTADAATHAAAVALMPAVPDNKTMLGCIVVDNASGSNFVGGTTALDAGSVTVTYYDTRGTVPFIGTTNVLTLGDLNSRS